MGAAVVIQRAVQGFGGAGVGGCAGGLGRDAGCARLFGLRARLTALRASGFALAASQTGACARCWSLARKAFGSALVAKCLARKAWRLARKPIWGERKDGELGAQGKKARGRGGTVCGCRDAACVRPAMAAGPRRMWGWPGDGACVPGDGAGAWLGDGRGWGRQVCAWPEIPCQ